MFFKLIILLFSSGLGMLSYPNPVNYERHTVKAKSGDGVYSLLRRYGLANDYCNIEEFYEVNKLDKQEQLKTGLKYNIPVYIYKYDGKSIRSTIGIEDWKKAVRIQKYNEDIRAKGLRKTNYLDSKILWVPHHELYCYNENRLKENKNNTIEAKPKTEELPATVKTKPEKNIKLHNALFGSKYEEFSRIDNSLKGKVFYVVSGHGGRDPGAQCTTCKEILCEDEYAYDIALRLGKNLIQRGAIVEMIIQDKNDGIRDEMYLKCDTDEIGVNGKKVPRKQLPRLNARAKDINKFYRHYKKKGYKDQKAIMIHIDSNRSDLKMDTYFLYHKTSKSGKAMAKNMYSTFKYKYDQHQKNRGYTGKIKVGNLHMLRVTQPPAVYVELANIKNRNNQKRFTLPSNRQALADWMYEGLIK